MSALRSAAIYCGHRSTVVEGAKSSDVLKVAEADIDDLPVLLELRGQVDSAIAVGIAGIRRSGATWAEIGALTGITRQSAQERWGPRMAEFA